MVVLDKQDYTNTTQDHLAQRDTYRSLAADPMNNHKNKLINILRTIKAQGGLGEIPYKGLHLTSAGSQILWATQIS